MRDFGENGYRLASDWFALEASKVTPKRKFRKAIKGLFNVDIGSDHDVAVGISAVIEKIPLYNARVIVEQNGRFTNGVW